MDPSTQYPGTSLSPQLLNAFHNAPWLKSGSKGEGVELLQSMLWDLGYSHYMPKTFLGNTADGAYGKETTQAVTIFQRDHRLSDDGIAGHCTVGKLDELFAELMKPIPKAKLPKPSPRTSQYKIGTEDLIIRHDKAANNRFNSQSWTMTSVAMKQILIEAAEKHGSSYPFASRNLLHYFSATGADKTIDVGHLVETTQAGEKRHKDEVGQAMEFVELLDDGLHHFTSTRNDSIYFTPGIDPDYYFGMGGCASWGKGKVSVETIDGVPHYKMQFTFHVCDLYNWDGGKKTNMPLPKTIEDMLPKTFDRTISDEFLNDFHLQGLAQEFHLSGDWTRVYTWKKGDTMIDVVEHF